MKLDEALEQLRLGPGINEDVSAEYNDAVDMAIEALEQELILDKIRSEIMDTGAYEQETKGKTEFLNGINYCLSIIDKYKAERINKEWQEPCEDCISRQAALEKAIYVPIAKVMIEDKVIYRKIIFADDIENLPPVTPQQKGAERRNTNV